MGGDDPESYNTIFETYVRDDQADSDQLSGMVSYALYKIAKREWVTNFVAANERRPSSDEMQAFVSTYTPSRIEGLRKEANSVIGAFTGVVLRENAPRIREEALRGKFVTDVGTSVVGAAVYTVLLLALAVTLRFFGIDLLSVFAELRP